MAEDALDGIYTARLIEILEVVDSDDLDAAAAALRSSMAQHIPTATCQCPAVVALATLLDRGYTITRKEG